MNKKTMRIICAVTVIVCLIFTVSNVCLALNVSDVKSNYSVGSENSWQSVSGKIASAIRNVGIILAVVILMVLGVKYMMGSASEKAEYKKTMIPYIVGAILLFGASAIAQLVVSTAENITE